MKTNMTVHQLVREYYKHHPDGYYFDKATLKFFGETLSTMRVFRHTTEITDYRGKTHTCYILSKLSRNHPMGAQRTYAYFDINTFDYFTQSYA